MNARVVQQVSIFIENRPGTFAAIAEKLAGAGVNLMAISISESIDHAVVRMITSDAEKARQMFAKDGVIALESEVLEIALEDRPGALAEFTNRLTDADINLEYAYGSSPADSSIGLIIISVDNPSKALEIAASI